MNKHISAYRSDDNNFEEITISCTGPVSLLTVKGSWSLEDAASQLQVIILL